MRKLAVAALIGSLLLLALVPWLLSGCEVRSLVPDELRQERLNYEATVTAAQGATVVAMRTSTSISRVVPVGTLPVPTQPPQPSNPVPTSNVTIRTMSVSETGVTALPPAIAPAILTSLPIITPTLPPGEWALPTPFGMVDTQDTITEQALTEELQQAASGQPIVDLRTSLTKDGFRIVSRAAVFPGVFQQIEAQGYFIVENYSLVAKITSITSDGQDVTHRFAASLESRLNTSLYALLPQRFVQRVTLTLGQMVVESKVRP